jgi:DNA-binding response OmpR family regulator
MTTPSRRVLVVEDDRVINQAVSDRLEAEGYTVLRAYDGPGAVAAYAEHDPHVVVLDVMLPGYDGHEVCRRIQATRPVPVIMLTARTEESDVLVGLGVGADDYLTKPFRMRELVARVAALLRRVERAGELLGRRALELGDLRVDPAARRVWRRDEEVRLTPTEFDLLVCLAARTEGIVLDPVYTGRAMAGLVAAVREGDVRRGERTVFMHTGGLPGVFGSTALAGRLA